MIKMSSESSLELLPQPVKDHVIKKANQEYELKDTRFSVSELVYCLRKPFFRRKYPIPVNLTKAWYFFRGKLFHEAFANLFPRNEVPVTHRIKGTPIVISGRLDVMHEGQVIEFKTTNSLKYTNEVKPEHRMQAAFYAWCQGLDKATVIYLDLNTAKKFEVTVNERDIETLEKIASTLYEAIKTGIPPVALNKQDWECSAKYCDYFDRCDKK